MKTENTYSQPNLSHDDCEKIHKLANDFANTRAGTSTRIDRLDDLLDFVDSVVSQTHIGSLNKGIEVGEHRGTAELASKIKSQIKSLDLPFYAYGDNEAACWMESELNEINKICNENK